MQYAAGREWTAVQKGLREELGPDATEGLTLFACREEQVDPCVDRYHLFA